jgi:phosphoglycerol transferase MdoB-like AlkP superfamily enzyme
LNDSHSYKFIITGIGVGIWLIVRATTRKERTETLPSGLSIEILNNRRIEEDYRFTPKKVLVYCIIVGLVSGTLSIFIDWLVLLSMAAFVFASITIWYIFGDKLHKWKERRSRNMFTGQ